MEPSTADRLESLRAIAAGEAGLEFLVLVGSRARGDARADSDWDFAYGGDTTVDPGRLHAAFSLVLDTDRIDLADLDRANGLFRFRSAADGRVIFDRNGAWDRFRLEAISFWCDMGPVIEAEYAALLSELGR